MELTHRPKITPETAASAPPATAPMRPASDPWAIAVLPPLSREDAAEERRMSRYDPKYPGRNMAYSRPIRVGEVVAFKAWLAALASRNPKRLELAEQYLTDVIEAVRCDYGIPSMPEELLELFR